MILLLLVMSSLMSIDSAEMVFIKDLSRSGQNSFLVNSYVNGKYVISDYDCCTLQSQELITIEGRSINLLPGSRRDSIWWQKDFSELYTLSQIKSISKGKDMSPIYTDSYRYYYVYPEINSVFISSVRYTLIDALRKTPVNKRFALVNPNGEFLFLTGTNRLDMDTILQQDGFSPAFGNNILFVGNCADNISTLFHCTLSPFLIINEYMFPNNRKILAYGKFTNTAISLVTYDNNTLIWNCYDAANKRLEDLGCEVNYNGCVRKAKLCNSGLYILESSEINDQRIISINTNGLVFEVYKGSIRTFDISLDEKKMVLTNDKEITCISLEGN